MGDQEISKEMTSMHRHECRCKGYIRNSQTRGWRKSVHLEKLTCEEYKNYSGDGEGTSEELRLEMRLKRKAGHSINLIKGFECYSEFSWKPLRLCMKAEV